jgi:hypothetical protein
MAIIIESPTEVYSVENNNNLKVFLAGGITGCENWQAYAISELQDIPGITLYNPRRKTFNINNPKETEIQITWEFQHLRDADIILYWFAKGSINPIVLYELGMWGNSDDDRMIFIGVDPEYERKQDVIIQTSLARPNLQIFESLTDMIETLIKIVNAINNFEENDDD